MNGAGIPEQIRWIVGIDEVGRGPLAGPVTLGAVLFAKENYEIYKKSRGSLPLGIDSKKLSPEAREGWKRAILALKAEGVLDYAVSFVSHEVIDTKGLSYAIRKAVKKCLDKLQADPALTLVLLDGGLKAPSEFMHQQTIIKGDESKPFPKLVIPLY